MPETRLTRALLTAAICVLAVVLVILVLRLVTFLMGEPKLWALVVLAATAGFSAQWFLDRRS